MSVTVEADVCIGIETSFDEIFKSVKDDREKLLKLSEIFEQFVESECWDPPSLGFRYIGYFDKTEDYNESIIKLREAYPYDFSYDQSTDDEKIEFVKFVRNCFSSMKRRKILFCCKNLSFVPLELTNTDAWSCGSDNVKEECEMKELVKIAEMLGIISPKITRHLFL